MADKYCVIDNPLSWRREWWCNGRLIQFISAEVFYQRLMPHSNAKVRDFTPGEYAGELKALPAKLRDELRYNPKVNLTRIGPYHDKD